MDKTLELAQFVDQPFRLLPGEKVTVWAGYKGIQETLLEMVEAPRSDQIGLYEFVILHGFLGTGKSHALRYLKSLISEKGKDDIGSIVVYLERLKVSGNTDFLALYRSIMRLLKEDLERVAGEVAQVADLQIDKAWNALPQEARRLIKRQDFPAQQLPSIHAAMSPSFPALPSLLAAVNEGDANALAVLAGGKPKGVNPAKYGLDAFIDNEYEALRCLSAFINLCTSPIEGDDNNDAISRCFYLFIDEVETLRDIPVRNVQSINQGLRDLINACPEHFCLVLGASAEAAELEAWLADDVMTRLSRPPIEIPELEVDQAMEFLKEVMQQFRTSEAKVPDSYPFDEDALREIVSQTTERRPRSLFRNCQTVLRKAVLSERLEENGSITIADVQDFL